MTLLSRLRSHVTLVSLGGVCLYALLMCGGCMWLAGPPAVPPGPAFTSETPREADADAKDWYPRVFDDLEKVPREQEQPPQQAGDMSITIREAVRLALAGNHRIRVASHGPEQAAADLAEARSVYDTELFGELTYSHDENAEVVCFEDTAERTARTKEGTVGLRQHLPTGATVSIAEQITDATETGEVLGDQDDDNAASIIELTQPLLRNIGDRQNRAAIKVARIDRHSSYQTFRREVIEAVFDTTQSYWELDRAEKDVRIAERNLAMARDVLEHERSRREEGLSNPLNVHRALEAVEQRGAALDRARQAADVAEDRLKLALNASATPVGSQRRILTADDPTSTLYRVNPEAAMKRALQHRPELRNAAYAVESGKVHRRLARHNLLPRLDLKGTYRHNTNDDPVRVGTESTEITGRNDWTVGLFLTVPLGNLSARARLRKRRSQLREAEMVLTRTQDRIRTQVRVAVHSIEVAAGEIPSARRAVRAAEKVLEGERARFELGQISNLELLRAQDLLARARNAYVRAVTDYNIALSELYRSEGTLLRQMDIAFTGADLSEGMKRGS